MEGIFRQLANQAKHGVSAEPLPAHVSHIDPSPPDPCSPPTCHHPHLTFCTWGQTQDIWNLNTHSAFQDWLALFLW